MLVIFFTSWLVGSICFALGAMWQRRRNTKVGTPSASHNSAIDAIAEQYIMDKMLDSDKQLVVRDFVWYVQQQHQ